MRKIIKSFSLTVAVCILACAGARAQAKTETDSGLELSRINSTTLMVKLTTADSGMVVLRYRPVATRQWTIMQSGEKVVSVSGLLPLTPYEFQWRIAKTETEESVVNHNDYSGSTLYYDLGR